MNIDIKNKLDNLAKIYNTPDFIKNDPIQFTYRYQRLQDIEIAGILVAVISWGQRPAILKSAEKMFSILGDSPYEYIMNRDFRKLGTQNIHRTFFEYDLAYICHGFYHIYNKYESLEEVFSHTDNIWDGIDYFRYLMHAANQNINCKHIPNPNAGSACKRLNMALRWFVRKDRIVDLGIWKRISPDRLLIPLDTHVARVSRELSILHRKQNDRKAVDELTGFLKQLNPDDPTVYDFALFGYGLENRSLNKK